MIQLCLLHALHKYASAYPLRAIHIDHGLHAASADWANTCAEISGSLDVPFVARKVIVARDTGRGLEAAAREARYSALAEQLAPDELLVTAHHRQ